MRHARFYVAQAERQMSFPADRIAFRRDSLDKDIEALKAYQRGAINFDNLCGRIAWNNYLETYFPGGKIPADIMHNELRIMGYE